MTRGPHGRYVSFHLVVKGGSQRAPLRAEVVMSDGRKFGLSHGTYFIRVWLDRGVRGMIRHEETGQQAYFQISDRLVDFIRGRLVPGAAK